MHITNIPSECIMHVLLLLDLPDQHSLLLTCRDLFYKVVPGLYRSPFRAIIAFDGWQCASTSANYTRKSSDDTRFINTSNTAPIVYNPSDYSRPDVGEERTQEDHNPGNISTYASSSSSISSISSNYTSSVSGTSPPQAHYTTEPQANSNDRQQKQKYQQHPSSLQRRSYSEHAKSYSANSNGYSANLVSIHQTNPKHMGSISSYNVSNNTDFNLYKQSKPAGNAVNSSLEQLKLRKITRLLQLLIACTSVQARLPALRYPGYGQQWIRPPCKVDYLQYYVDQQQGEEIMIRCFHLLFADLVQCQWEDATLASGLGTRSIPIAVTPPDREAYKVLHQISREFMNHCAARIHTLSISSVHTIMHAIDLVPQLANVTRLELTDLDLDQELHGFRVEQVVDFVKSHRMLFGPILKDITLVGKVSSSSPLSFLDPYSVVLASSPPSSPTTLETTFAALSAPIPSVHENLNKNHDNNVLLVLENLKNLERIDATRWPNCILYLDRIIPDINSNTTPNGNSITASASSPPTPIKLQRKTTTSTASSLKTLRLSFTFPPSESVDSKPARLSYVLERCRNLEDIRIPVRRSDVFTWAANEKRTSLICTPILASSKSKRLPRVRRLHLHGPSSELMDCVYDAAFAFQDTLEDLEARSILRVWQPTTPVWEGSMVRLRRLKLEGEVCLHFSLESLKQCPALEELSLTLPLMEAWRFHQKQSSTSSYYRQSHNPGLSQISVIRQQNVMRIAELKHLKKLTLSGCWQVSDIIIRRIADRCHYLKELRLNRTVGTTIGGLLLGVENMSRLEILDLTLDIVDLHLVRVVTRKLALLSYLQLTNLRQEN